MKLVVDTNVLLSALIADSVTRTLLGAIEDTLVAPVELKRELSQHSELVLEKSGLSEPEIEELTSRLFDHLEFVPDSELEAYRAEAVDELADVDPDDVIFLAASLAVDGGSGATIGTFGIRISSPWSRLEMLFVPSRPI